MGVGIDVGMDWFDVSWRQRARDCERLFEGNDALLDTLPCCSAPILATGTYYRTRRFRLCPIDPHADFLFGLGAGHPQTMRPKIDPWFDEARQPWAEGLALIRPNKLTKLERVRLDKITLARTVGVYHPIYNPPLTSTTVPVM